MHYFLVVYLWHGGGLYTGSTGGPALAVTPAPSRAACEQLGAAVKQFADAQASGDRSASGAHCSGALSSDTGRCATRPAEYRCVAIRD